MERRLWRGLSLCLGLLLCQLCNGLPINLENTVADCHTQFLTGLVAVLLTVCSVVLVAGCLCCQRRNGFKEFRDSPVVASTAILDHGHINPVANGEFTIFTPLSQNNNVFLANEQIITRARDDYVYGDFDVTSWFDGSEKDFPRTKLKYIKEIGKGWFGRVVEGAAQDEEGEQKWTPVMVRILDATASSRERVVFLHDAAIYRSGGHPSVLGLFGRCLDTIPLLLLQEHCPKGDLKKYLKENSSTGDKLLSSEYPLVWCCQLTSAIKHLHDHKLTHPDLSARNCQLTSNLALKLGDYGLAVFQYPEDYYQGAPGVPLRWCAPETISYTSTTIEPKKVTSEANIWSLGVTLWEICECGAQPYCDLSDDEVISQVLGAPGVRLSRPKFQLLYTDYIYQLMQMCWTGGESRPAVSQVDLMLADLLQVYKNTKSDSMGEDFDKRWEVLKPNNIVKTDNNSTEMDDVEPVNFKALSPSLNNLHGSLDNLQMESWLEDVANKTDDPSYVKGLSDAMKDLDQVLESSSTKRPKLEFKLGPVDDGKPMGESSPEIERSSSGSETEEENWKKKIERGAYSEKVRQKSRSVADLMVLTHIEQSESEPETPLPSLDYRVNYKNVRYAAPKQNLENVSLTFGSEGNLLSVQDTFQQELRRMQEKRRDSLLFVPENNSQSSDSFDSKRLMQELNGPNEIKPQNQVFNVFNVTIDEFSPVRSKLGEFMHVRQVPKLTDIIQSNADLVEYLSRNSSPFEQIEKSDDGLYDSGVEGDRVESTESLLNHSDDSMTGSVVPDVQSETTETEEITTREHNHLEKTFQVPKLMDLIQDNNELMDYIIAKYEEETADKLSESFDSLEATPAVDFDLSESQEEVRPNNLTHSIAASSLNLPEDNLYSLETWDHFLGDALDNQNEGGGEMFDSFTSEPRSLLFLENGDDSEARERTSIADDLDRTYTLERGGTFDADDGDLEIGSTSFKGESNAGGWEAAGGGWFLHPQSSSDISGEITVRPSTSTDTYVGFNMDDEIMAAIRTELLTKLPQAQGASSGTADDDEEEEEWETTDRNEVYLKYNVYNTPLSPIPEESSFLEEDSCETTPKQQSDDDDEDSDWSDRCERQHPVLQRHTPSQESCCSNDTLFNLEELAINDPERDNTTPPHGKTDESHEEDSERTLNEMTHERERSEDSERTTPIVITDSSYVGEFLNRERVESSSENSSFLLAKQMAPLPSPEDKPWKQLPASLLTYDKVMFLPESNVPESQDNNIADIYNEADYVNIVNMENARNAELINNTGECVNCDRDLIIANDENDEGGRDIFEAMLTDIRFSGPADSNLMSTSFSESNDLNDEQDWDSGSDTRSSSSGEFIWKEGEYEESLKALRAAPQDLSDDVKPMEGIREETSTSESSSTETDDDEDDGDSPEFVPSAWDKYATPTKSALRSPEETLEKTEKKKARGVWFKKQKYHCVYEYPKEPESPVLQSYDLWRPEPDFSSFADWELDDAEPSIPPESTDETDGPYQPKSMKTLNLYQLSSIPDFTSEPDEGFFISSSSKPFDLMTGLSSQFFPGGWGPKMNDNVTPDSGVEDITPADLTDKNFVAPTRKVQSLKELASEAVNKSKKVEKSALGGLRHTRNRLKLDLPPSPSAFTSGKIFNIEPTLDPVVNREKPTFTTFGKSRFLVQHVDTPPDDENDKSKNVSFEALPYKPLQTKIIKEDFQSIKNKGKVEIVRGEASLLDSADEDSGIESSTLERKLSNVA